MNKMTREEKLFKRENDILEQHKNAITRGISAEECREALIKLTARYEALLNQTRFLTWISGRLERKLHRTNRELHDNNRSLQQALHDVTKAEAGRRAYAIIYFIAIVLFVLEEYFLEPIIAMMGDSINFGIAVKLIIVLMLKVSEGFIERKMTRKRALVTAAALR
jgi:hypothetical protein